MIVLRTFKEIQYSPVIVAVINTSNPFQPEIKVTKITRKIKVIVTTLE